MATNTTSLTLSCASPRSFLLSHGYQHTGHECISAQLLNAVGRVAVLCGYLPPGYINNTDLPYAPYYTVWDHTSLLSESNQTARCFPNHVMQLVGLFANNLSEIALNVTYSYGNNCSGPFQSPKSYLEGRLSNLTNTTFTLGLSKEITSCIPPRPAPLEPPNQNKDNYPLAFYAKQDFILPPISQYCQTYTIQNRSDVLGNFTVSCINGDATTLSSTSPINDSITCHNQYVAITYTPGHELGTSDDTSVTIARDIFPCADSGSKGLSMDVIMGIAVSAFGVLGVSGVFMGMYCYDRKYNVYNDPQPPLRTRLINEEL